MSKHKTPESNKREMVTSTFETLPTCLSGRGRIEILQIMIQSRVAC
jgi:hypothetical protein